MFSTEPGSDLSSIASRLREGMRPFEHGAVDTHAHVIPPFVPVPAGPGTKPPAEAKRTKEEYAAVLNAHGFTHGLLVQPSGYHFNNSVMLCAMHESAGKVKGVAVTAPTASDAELDALERGGVVGVRLNLVSLDPDFFENSQASHYLARLRERGWWLQVHLKAPDFPRYEPYLRRFAGPVVIDHMGRPNLAAGLSEPGLQRLLAFGREGGNAIKLSGAVYSTGQTYPFSELDPLVEAIVEAFGLENCVWGSDWPFIHGHDRVTYLDVLAWLLRLFPSVAEQRTILWDNPCRLGFAAPSTGSAGASATNPRA
jgi:predicted TIM-barrel fold metal-dependent hydrolase